MIALATAAFTLGLMGGLHCLVMCGPLAAAACADRGDGRPALGAYLSGRLLGHVFTGAVLGHLGRQAAGSAGLDRLRDALILVIAALAAGRGLWLLACHALGQGQPSVPVGAPLARRRGAAALLRLVAGLISRRPLGLGLATAVFPCGLLASAWSLAATAGHPLYGAAAMGVFSLASAPGPSVGVLAGGRLLPAVRSPMVAGLAWCLVSATLAARPLIGVMGGRCH